MPLALPGDAVSPGTSNCNFAKDPTPTVTPALVPDWRAPAESLAVIVWVPALLKVKLAKWPVPDASVKLPAVAPLSSEMLALLSELVIVTLVVALVMTFQLASTAFTVMPLAIAVPEVCAVGVPVLPVEVPGAAVSPGSKI